MRILIVDDRPLGARKLRDDILAAEPDYQVKMATTVDATSAAVRAKQIVSEATERFDVFLIDDNLGAGPNGSELMTELRQISPSSEAIIFTAYGDEAGKQRAIEAGARAYITRPVNEKELLWQLHGVQKDQNTQRERDWLQLLAATTTKELQEATSIQDAGQAIVNGAQQLGFQRARLRMACGGQGEQLELIGVSQVGNIGLDDFTTIKRQLKDLPYSQKVIVDTKKPTLFHGRELERAPWDEYVTPPKDDWFKVPLFISDEPIGTLSLDNGTDPCKYSSEEQRQLETLLDLFGKQAAAALARARLQEQADHQAKTQRLLNQVSLAVTEQAAKGDLNTLLDALRKQIREHLQFDMDDFAVALLNEGEPASHYLDCYYEHKDGQTQPGRHWCNFLVDPAKAWIAQMIRDGRPGQDPAGRQIGIPLKVQGTVIGAMLIQGKQAQTFDETMRDQLVAIATHVAGLVHAIYREERDKEQRQRKKLLDQLIARLRQLAHTDENHFWHALLTFAFHRDGYGFNRAVLFRYSAEGHVMQGRMGIGHFDRVSWQGDVAADEAAGEDRSFAAYLVSSSVSHLHTTPLATATLDWQRELEDDQQDPFRRVYVQGTFEVLAAAELKMWLPVPELIFEKMQPSTTCALVPWKDGEQVVGVLLVDNAMDNKPVRQEDLAALEDLLAQASQILDDAGEVTRLRRQGESYEKILKLSQQLMAQTDDVDLKELLRRLCQEALDITKADFVVLYPLGPDGASYETRYITVEGTPFDKDFLFENKPRQKGVAAHVLHSGTLAINNVGQSSLEFNGLPLSEQRYIVREQVSAFIGVPIGTVASLRSLGVLFFDFRQPKSFSESDILQVEQLAGVAGMVIGNANLVEQEAERYALQESNSLQAIQEESLAPDTSEEKVIRVALQQAGELFGRQANVTLMQRTWITDESQERVQERFRYLRWNPLTHYEDADASDTAKEIMRKASIKGETILEGDTVAVPIKTGYSMMGCICVIGYKDVSPARIERLAIATAAALDNVRRQVRLRAALEAVQQTVTPASLEQVLNAVITSARRASPEVECITLWYRDPISKKHMLGEQWGLFFDPSDSTSLTAGNDQEQQPLIEYVMQLEDPLWAVNVHDKDADELLLKSAFIERQQLVSVAAFPLRIGDECFGALFFSYRRPHRFSPSERDTLPIFAATAAASIYDAQLLEQAKQGENRLGAALTVVDAVGTELNLDAVLLQVLTELKRHFDKPYTEVQPYVMLYDQDEDALYLPAVARAFAPADNPLYTNQFRLHLDGSDKGIVCRVARKSREHGGIYVENIADVRSDLDFLPFNSRTESLLCAGLTNKGRLWGVLAVNSPERGAFDEQDKLLLELAAQQALIAMEHAEEAAKLRFREAVSSVTTWAAELAHDINREVYSMRSRADWLRRKEKNLSEQGQVWVQEIDDIAVRLADAARSARSDQQASMQTFNLDQMLSVAVLDLVARRWPNVIVHTDFGCANIEIHSYRGRLWRAVRHLVRNAAEAMAESGTLTVRTRCSEVRVEIQIEDTGPGVLEDKRDKLFNEPYTSKGSEGDRGYGLLIARSLAESIGGQIRLLPQEVGHGAVFSLTLPRASATMSTGFVSSKPQE